MACEVAIVSQPSDSADAVARHRETPVQRVRRSARPQSSRSANTPSGSARRSGPGSARRRPRPWPRGRLSRRRKSTGVARFDRRGRRGRGRERRRGQDQHRHGDQDRHERCDSRTLAHLPTSTPAVRSRGAGYHSPGALRTACPAASRRVISSGQEHRPPSAGQPSQTARCGASVTRKSRSSTPAGERASAAPRAPAPVARERHDRAGAAGRSRNVWTTSTSVAPARSAASAYTSRWVPYGAVGERLRVGAVEPVGLVVDDEHPAAGLPRDHVEHAADEHAGRRRAGNGTAPRAGPRWRARAAAHSSPAANRSTSSATWAASSPAGDGPQPGALGRLGDHRLGRASAAGGSRAARAARARACRGRARSAPPRGPRSSAPAPLTRAAPAAAARARRRSGSRSARSPRARSS